MSMWLYGNQHSFWFCYTVFCLFVCLLACLLCFVFFRKEEAHEGQSTSDSLHEAGSSPGGRDLCPRAGSLRHPCKWAPGSPPLRGSPFSALRVGASAPTTPGRGFYIAHVVSLCQETLEKLGKLCKGPPPPILGPKRFPTRHRGHRGPARCRKPGR